MAGFFFLSFYVQKPDGRKSGKRIFSHLTYNERVAAERELEGTSQQNERAKKRELVCYRDQKRDKEEKAKDTESRKSTSSNFLVKRATKQKKIFLNEKE